MLGIKNDDRPEVRRRLHMMVKHLIEGRLPDVDHWVKYILNAIFGAKAASDEAFLSERAGQIRRVEKLSSDGIRKMLHAKNRGWFTNDDPQAHVLIPRMRQFLTFTLLQRQKEKKEKELASKKRRQATLRQVQEGKEAKRKARQDALNAKRKAEEEAREKARQEMIDRRGRRSKQGEKNRRPAILQCQQQR